MYKPENLAVLERQLDFMREHVTSPKGVKFSTEGREEFIFWYLSALNGWKIGKNSEKAGNEYLDEPICGDCSEKLGEVTFNFALNYRCPNQPCVGLKAHKIYTVFLHADRRVGKTFTTGAHIIERMCRGRNYRARYIASGHDHTKELSEENIEGIINRDAEAGEGRLRDAISQIIKGKSLFNPHRNNKLTLVSSSGAANLGSGLSEIFVDEAKVVSFDLVNKLLPSIQEMHGWKCVACGWEHTGAIATPTRCPNCGKSNEGLPVDQWTLMPWNARAVFMSNAGTVSGDAQYDWFDQMVDDLLERPHPNVEVGRFDDNSINPDVDLGIKAMAKDLISRVPGLEGHVNEWDNEAKSIGQPFVDSWSHIFKPRAIQNIGQSYEPVIAFIDMARTVDLVSVHAFRDDTPDAYGLSWEYLDNVYLEYWDPQDPKSGITIFSPHENKRVVDEDLLFARLHDILIQWPNVKLVWIDTRFSKLGEKILKRLRETGAPYSKMCFAYEGRADERSAAYTTFESKINTSRIKLLWSQRADLEFKKAVWVQTGSKMSVRERGRSHNENQRRKNHLDILEGAATCCLMGFELRKSGGTAAAIKQSRDGVHGNNNLGRSVPKQRYRQQSVDRHIQPAGERGQATFHSMPPSRRGPERRNVTRERLSDF